MSHVKNNLEMLPPEIYYVSTIDNFIIYERNWNFIIMPLNHKEVTYLPNIFSDDYFESDDNIYFMEYL